MSYIYILGIGFILCLVFSKLNLVGITKSILWVLLYFCLMILFERQSDYAAVMALIILYYSYKKEDNIIRLKPIRLLKSVSSGIIINQAITYISIFIVWLLLDAKTFSTVSKDVIQYNTEISGEFFYLICTSGFLVPLAEELLFRYMMVGRIFKNEKFITRLIVPALICGLAYQVLLQMIIAFLFSLILNYIYIKTNDIMTTVGIHMGINIGAVFAIETGLVVYVYLGAIILLIGLSMVEKRVK